MYTKNRTWAEISLDNILHNFYEFRRISKAPKIMCVVKANAYGHGAVTIAKTYEEAGCDYLSVAAIDEALELRKNGIKSNILVMNYVIFDCLGEAVKNDISLTVFSLELADAISKVASSLGKTATVHIKIDTGMTRVGLNYNTACDVISQIYTLPNLYIEGIFTHFASADETDKTYTQLQFERYMNLIDELVVNNINIPVKHVANSAASIMYPEMHLDMIRPGVSLYGCYPSEEVDKSRINLKPCMQLKTQVVRVNKVAQNIPISYGRIFTTANESKIATIPIGYADGFSRVLIGKARTIVNGQYAPVVGKICMDQCMIDVTNVLEDVKLLDEVIIFGGAEDSSVYIPIEEVAAGMGTINYEIMCIVTRRVPRLYTINRETVSVENYLI